MRFFTLLTVCTLLAPQAWAARERYKLERVGIYGTTRVSGEDILAKYGEEIKRYLNRKGVKSKMVQAEAERMREKIVQGVKQMGGFPWIELHEVRAKSSDKYRHLIFFFEVIEKEDMARRLPLREAPKADIKDTSGLLEAYNEYDAAGWALVRKNELRVERQECPAYFCTWGGVRPNLERLQSRFESTVPSYKKLLTQILNEDKDETKRAHAVYLLAYLDDGPELSNIISQGLMDPSAKVRKAVMDVYTDIAIYNPDVPIPVHQILRLMDFPYPEDRDRALSLMLSLSDNPDYRSFLLHKASKPILKLLREGSPANREMAHTVLRMMSDAEHPMTDAEAWENWVWKARREKAEE